MRTRRAKTNQVGETHSAEQFNDWMNSLIAKAKSLRPGTIIVLQLPSRISPEHFSKQKEKYSERDRHKLCLALFQGFIESPLPGIEVEIQGQTRSISLTQVELLEEINDLGSLVKGVNEVFWHGHIDIRSFMLNKRPSPE